jgi:Zeta toxin
VPDLHVTELFLDDGAAASAPDGDGLVWKTVCRTGQWRLSPIPGGKPLVIDKALFDDVKRAFDDGAWEHVTVPLSHKDRVDENTGYVKALKVEEDARRPGEYVLRAGMRFTDPAIREKVTNGSIANTSVGIALTGHTRTRDGKHYPRVLKHVALTNQPWLDGLEPFGEQLAAAQEEAHGEPLVYLLDWDPAKHPRWPEGTPKLGGKFMRVSQLLDQIASAGRRGKHLDVSFLAHGADRITKVTAHDVSRTDSNGKVTKIAHFDVTLKGGEKHQFEVTEGGIRDGALIQGALKEIDAGGEKVHGIGDARQGQTRQRMDPVLEHVLSEAEKDPTLHPPIKMGNVTRELLSQEKPGGRPLTDGKPHGNTMQQYTTGGKIDPSNGEVVGSDVVWSRERKKLHDEIVAFFLSERNRTPGTRAPGSKPIAVFTAGGAAVGKSTALEGNPDALPPDAVKIDPDEIKKWLPEYRDAVSARDKYAGTLAHEESSVLAKRIQAEAQRLGLNIVVDGAGDSGSDKFAGKLRETAHGNEAKGIPPYDVHVFFVDAPTELASARSVLRGSKTGRFMPLEMLRAQHNSVATRHEEWRTDPAITSWHAYSTATPTPTLVASGGGGDYQVHDAHLYAQMLGKASRRSEDTGRQTVANQTAPRDAVPRRRSTDRPPAGESEMQRALERHSAAAGGRTGDPVVRGVEGKRIQQIRQRAFEIAARRRSQDALDEARRRMGVANRSAPDARSATQRKADKLEALNEAQLLKMREDAIRRGDDATRAAVDKHLLDREQAAVPRAIANPETATVRELAALTDKQLSDLYVRYGLRGDEAMRKKIAEAQLAKQSGRYIAASITITDPPPELVLAVWDSALHPRGGRGRFVRKLLDAAGNTAVREVGEAGHSLQVSLHTGATLHVEPVSANRVRVLRVDANGGHVRTSVHAIADLTNAHPALRGLTGLIRSKARKVAGGHQVTRRVPGSRPRRGIKDLVHYGSEREMAASQRGGGDNQMADGEGNEGQETLTLSREEFQEAVAAAVEAEREQDRLELARSSAEVRELRVERRIAKLQEAGHAPSLLKVAEQIMLADETGDPVLTLSQEDGSDKPLTATAIVEELLAAMPETALTASQPTIPGRAEGDGGEQPEDSEAFEKRIDATWESMHKDGKHLVG